jgi:hypothetical protein
LVSFGVALSSSGYDNAEDVPRDAGPAMYRATHHGDPPAPAR